MPPRRPNRRTGPSDARGVVTPAGRIARGIAYVERCKRDHDDATPQHPLIAGYWRMLFGRLRGCAGRPQVRPAATRRAGAGCYRREATDLRRLAGTAVFMAQDRLGDGAPFRTARTH